MTAGQSAIRNPQSTILFEPKPGGPTPVRVSHGDYMREFHGVKWPQEAMTEEWETYLRESGLFVEAKKATGSARGRSASG